jgi:hypothetical protein
MDRKALMEFTSISKLESERVLPLAASRQAASHSAYWCSWQKKYFPTVLKSTDVLYVASLFKLKLKRRLNPLNL